MANKIVRGFSIDKELSHRLDSVMTSIKNLQDVIISDEDTDTEIHFVNVSQLVEWILKKILPQLENKIYKLQKK